MLKGFFLAVLLAGGALAQTPAAGSSFPPLLSSTDPAGSCPSAAPNPNIGGGPYVYYVFNYNTAVLWGCKLSTNTWINLNIGLSNASALMLKNANFVLDTSGAANTLTGATTTAFTPYALGMLFVVEPANSNTGATTMNINALGAVAVTKLGGTALSSGDLVAGRNYVMVYNTTGPRFEVVTLGGGGSGTVSVVGAGNLTSGACATGGGTTTIQTPSTLCTVDSSGNMVVNTLLVGASAPSLSWFTGTGGIWGQPNGTCSGTVPASAGFFADCAGVPTWMTSSASSAFLLSGCTSCVSIAALSSLGSGIGTALGNAPQGNGTKFQMAAGAYVNGHCQQYDTNGNTTDSGGACGGGGGSAKTEPEWCNFGCAAQGSSFNTVANVLYMQLMDNDVCAGVYGNLAFNANTFINQAWAIYQVPSSGSSTTLVATSTTSGGWGGGTIATPLSYTTDCSKSYYLAVSSSGVANIQGGTMWNVTNGTPPTWPRYGVGGTHAAWSGSVPNFPPNTTVCFSGCSDTVPAFVPQARWTK